MAESLALADVDDLYDGCRVTLKCGQIYLLETVASSFGGTVPTIDAIMLKPASDHPATPVAITPRALAEIEQQGLIRVER
jgi:hypothetical protein